MSNQDLVSICVALTDTEFLSSLPYGSEYYPPERILCAANRYGYVILAGVRHGCGVMSNILHIVDGELHLRQQFEDCDKVEQGFITSKGRYVSRQEAWKIALDQRQIVRRVGGNTANGGTLYSENLY